VLNTNNRAFKEWAAVVRAMEEGASALIVRKGGIVEEGGAFRVQDPEFFLFPNHTHQNAAQLKPSAHPWLAETEADRPEEGYVRISSYAAAAAVHVIPDEDALARLDGLHLWTRAYVLERLRFKPSQPLYAIVLRVYNLPADILKPYLADYGGCTSWITLDEALSTEGAAPAMTDAAFDAERARIEDALGPRAS
jgi:hypothetical protein